MAVRVVISVGEMLKSAIAIETFSLSQSKSNGCSIKEHSLLMKRGQCIWVIKVGSFNYRTLDHCMEVLNKVITLSFKAQKLPPKMSALTYID